MSSRFMFITRICMKLSGPKTILGPKPTSALFVDFDLGGLHCRTSILKCSGSSTPSASLRI